jgi:hypothetical protein
LWFAAAVLADLFVGDCSARSAKKVHNPDGKYRSVGRQASDGGVRISEPRSPAGFVLAALDTAIRPQGVYRRR